MNENKNRISNLWDAVKALFRIKSIGINAYFRKNRFKINYPSFLHNKLEKEGQTKSKEI